RPTSSVQKRTRGPRRGSAVYETASFSTDAGRSDAVLLKAYTGVPVRTSSTMAAVRVGAMPRERSAWPRAVFSDGAAAVPEAAEPPRAASAAVRTSVSARITTDCVAQGAGGRGPV